MLLQACQSPRLYVADGFATDAEITHVLSLANDAAYLADVPAVAKHDATGFSFEMPIDGDALLEGLRARVHDTIGIVNRVGQTMRFRRYAPGQSHPPHLDCYEISGAHLVCTALVSLADCARGGATRFPRAYPAPVEVAAVRGRLVAWFNYYPNGAPDESSYHEGAPVEEGEKVTLTAFIYAPLAEARVRPPVAAGRPEPAS